jgi:hypothetical protein
MEFFTYNYKKEFIPHNKKFAQLACDDLDLKTK